MGKDRLGSPRPLDRLVLLHFKRNHLSSILPNLDTVGAHETLGRDNGRRVIRATQGFKSFDVSVAAKQIRPILGHCPAPEIKLSQRESQFSLTERLCVTLVPLRNRNRKPN